MNLHELALWLIACVLLTNLQLYNVFLSFNLVC